MTDPMTFRPSEKAEEKINATIQKLGCSRQTAINTLIEQDPAQPQPLIERKPTDQPAPEPEEEKRSCSECPSMLSVTQPPAFLETEIQRFLNGKESPYIHALLAMRRA